MKKNVASIYLVNLENTTWLFQKCNVFYSLQENKWKNYSSKNLEVDLKLYKYIDIKSLVDHIRKLESKIYTYIYKNEDIYYLFKYCRENLNVAYNSTEEKQLQKKGIDYFKYTIKDDNTVKLTIVLQGLKNKMVICQFVLLSEIYEITPEELSRKYNTMFALFVYWRDFIESNYINGLFSVKGSAIKKTVTSLAQTKMVQYFVDKKPSLKEESKNILPNIFKIKDFEKLEMLNNFFYNFADRGGICSFNTQDIKKEFNNIYHYDINSNYPFQITKGVPVGLPKIYDELKENNPKKFYFVEVRGSYLSQINRNVVPLCPLKMTNIKGRGTQMFSNNEVINIQYSYDLITDLHALISLEEYEMYNNKDYFLTDLEIVKVFEFERSFEFVDFFKDLYKKRQAEPENKKFYKSMLNGLIGSFQASPFYKNKYLKNFLPPNFKIPEEQKELDFCFEFKENNTFKYFPFSCAVISLARVYLMENIMKYYRDSLKRVIYVDTDSMIVEKAWYNNIVDNKKIGCFKLEGVSDSFYLLKAKNYSSFNNRKKINLSLTKTAGFKTEELIPFFEKNVFSGQVVVFRTIFDCITFLPKIISFKTYF